MVQENFSEVTKLKKYAEKKPKDKRTLNSIIILRCKDKNKCENSACSEQNINL